MFVCGVLWLDLRSLDSVFSRARCRYYTGLVSSLIQYLFFIYGWNVLYVTVLYVLLGFGVCVWYRVSLLVVGYCGFLFLILCIMVCCTYRVLFLG